MKHGDAAKIGAQPFAEKIRKVGQLIRLAKTFPRRTDKTAPVHTSAK